MLVPDGAPVRLVADDTLIRRAGRKVFGAACMEDVGIPSRVIDELMGHAAGQRGHDGSATGPRYRWTTPEMEGRAVAAIEQRLAVALVVAESKERGRRC